MIIAYQMGPYPEGVSWDSLDLAIRLMQRLEPTAEIHVTHQGDLLHRIEGVTYHAQHLAKEAPYCDGRHTPLKFDITTHEVRLDNDCIIWELPQGWKNFSKREDAVLVWKCDWRYYGAYDPDIPGDWCASAGMWGVPPGKTMPFPIYKGGERNQDEYGFVVKWLYDNPPYEFIDEATEIRCYCPGHNALTNRDHRGTHGVHINGLNRGWNPKGAELVYQLRKELL